MKRIIRQLSSKRRPFPYGLRPTFGGLLFLLGTTLIVLAAIDGDVNLLVMVFGLCIGAFVLSACSGWLTLRGLAVKRILPDVLLAGQPFMIRYTVTNKRRWTSAKSIHLVDVLAPTALVESPETYIPILRPGETMTLSIPALSSRRGRVKFSTVAFATRFPFGIFTKLATVPLEQEATVFPTVGRLLTDVKAVSQSSDASSTGAATSYTGDEEYYGVREYRIGDNPRRIHWRRSARTGQLIIREMTKTPDHQLWCVIDTRINPGERTQAEGLELAISCAATVICDALERAVKVGLICNGRPLLVLPPGGGRAHRPRLLRELAIRELNTGDRLAGHIRRLAWPARWRAPCMLFGAVQSDDLSATARLLGRAIGQTTIYVPGTPAFDNLFRPIGPGVCGPAGGLAVANGRLMTALAAGVN